MLTYTILAQRKNVFSTAVSAVMWKSADSNYHCTCRRFHSFQHGQTPTEAGKKRLRSFHVLCSYFSSYSYANAILDLFACFLLCFFFRRLFFISIFLLHNSTSESTGKKHHPHSKTHRDTGINFEEKQMKHQLRASWTKKKNGREK